MLPWIGSDFDKSKAWTGEEAGYYRGIKIDQILTYPDDSATAMWLIQNSQPSTKALADQELKRAIDILAKKSKVNLKGFEIIRLKQMGDMNGFMASNEESDRFWLLYNNLKEETKRIKKDLKALFSHYGLKNKIKQLDKLEPEIMTAKTIAHEYSHILCRRKFGQALIPTNPDDPYLKNLFKRGIIFSDRTSIMEAIAEDLRIILYPESAIMPNVRTYHKDLSQPKLQREGLKLLKEMFEL